MFRLSRLLVMTYMRKKMGIESAARKNLGFSLCRYRIARYPCVLHPGKRPCRSGVRLNVVVGQAAGLEVMLPCGQIG